MQSYQPELPFMRGHVEAAGRCFHRWLGGKMTPRCESTATFLSEDDSRVLMEERSQQADGWKQLLLLK